MMILRHVGLMMFLAASLEAVEVKQEPVVVDKEVPLITAPREEPAPQNDGSGVKKRKSEIRTLKSQVKDMNQAVESLEEQISSIKGGDAFVCEAGCVDESLAPHHAFFGDLLKDDFRRMVSGETRRQAFAGLKNACADGRILVVPGMDGEKKVAVNATRANACRAKK